VKAHLEQAPYRNCAQVRPRAEIRFLYDVARCFAANAFERKKKEIIVSYARMIRTITAAFALSLVAWTPARAYDYPVKDPFVATVLGTPEELQYPVPERVDARRKELRRYPERELPSAFWDQTWMYYGVAPQKQRAPLIFVIAGTGADYESQKNQFLRNIFHGAGFHVITISSPTFPDFILSASEYSMPGYMPADTKDLYEIMKIAYRDLAAHVEISGVNLTGYSLGGTESAFLAEYDSHERFFKFDKVFLINPSVNLFTSITLLDGLFDENFKKPGAVEKLLVRLLKRITEHVQTSNEPIDSEFLYQAAEHGNISDIDLRSLIATVFRITAGNIVFTSDAMTGGGRVIEPGAKLNIGTSLTTYFKRSMSWPFTKYFDDMLLPYWQERVPGLTREQAIKGSGLSVIAGYLKGADNIALMTNRDDMILGNGDLEFLEETFGTRAEIYPIGGHCGNMTYTENVEHMLEFFGVSPQGETE
jgi:hypothetical protein